MIDEVYMKWYTAVVLLGLTNCAHCVVGKTQDEVFRKISKEAPSKCNTGDTVRIDIPTPTLGWLVGKYECYRE